MKKMGNKQGGRKGKGKGKVEGKVKARDIVEGWPRGKSHTFPDPTEEMKVIQFHLIFAEVMRDEDLIMRLALMLNEEAIYRIGQHDIATIYRHNRIADPTGETALAHFTKVAEEFSAPRLVRKFRENEKLRDAIRKGRMVMRNPYLN